MKNPKRVEAGRKAAAKRWGAARVVRLDDLTPAQRQLVLALIEAARENNQREPVSDRIRAMRESMTAKLSRSNELLEAIRKKDFSTDIKDKP